MIHSLQTTTKNTIIMAIEKKGFIQHPSKKVESVAVNGSVAEFKEYIKKYWLLPVHQLALLEPEMADKRDLYLEFRRPCTEFVWEVLSTTEDMDLVRRTVVGCELDIENELELASFEDESLMEEYITSNPSGPFLHQETVDYIIEELSAEMQTLAEKYKPLEVAKATTSIAGLFSPEQMAKLGI